jgi:hypothetical protein
MVLGSIPSKRVWTAFCVAFHHTLGSVSAHNGFGVWKGYSGEQTFKTSPEEETRSALTEDVPISKPIVFMQLAM